MKLNRTLFLLSAFFSYQAFAFPCYVTVMKDNCWKNYNVTVDMEDTSTEKSLVSVVISDQESWARGKFDCHPKQTFKLLGQFTPAFWASDEGKVYYGKRYWSLPEQIGDNVAWHMKLCYPSDFSEVPLPPDASGACQCDPSVITPIPEEKALSQ
jgi:hypothetical protein